jgi:hypothetical protein
MASRGVQWRPYGPWRHAACSGGPTAHGVTRRAVAALPQGPVGQPSGVDSRADEEADEEGGVSLREGGVFRLLMTREGAAMVGPYARAAMDLYARARGKQSRYKNKLQA